VHAYLREGRRLLLHPGLELDESLLDVEMVRIEGEARSLNEAHQRSRPCARSCFALWMQKMVTN
jgi:hypothetical protein